MAIVTEDTRQQLHQLLDQMLDEEGKELGTLSKAKVIGDGKLEIEEYRLVLRKKVEKIV